MFQQIQDKNKEKIWKNTDALKIIRTRSMETLCNNMLLA